MEKIIERQFCSGCGSCYNACPKQCISMQQDAEGFLYPYIDKNICINCGKCKNVCPVLSDYKGTKKGEAYACISKNEEIREKSSSGGIFTLIAEYVIDNHGVVFGAAFDDELNVHHIEVKSKHELDKIRGSKYLQSRIEDTYKRIKEYLKADIMVLFTGTPCQISGLKAYLGEEYQNLLTQDIICHGAPSPLIWQKYLKHTELSMGKIIDKNEAPQFRNKRSGWTNYSIVLNFTDNTQQVQKSSDNLYMRAFLHNLSLRPSCYNCHSKSLKRESDITLADFWGIGNILQDMFDDRGTSLVLVNSHKGQAVFERISDKILYRPVNIDDAVKYNASAYKSCDENLKRNSFMREITEANFREITEKYTKQNVIKKYFLIIKKRLKGSAGNNVQK